MAKYYVLIEKKNYRRRFSRLRVRFIPVVQWSILACLLLSLFVHKDQNTLACTHVVLARTNKLFLPSKV